MTVAETLAPAKLNLFLHVGGAESDGYHPVCSLMVFADAGDRLAIAPAGRDELVIEGPFAAELAGTAPEANLVSRALAKLRARAGVRTPPLQIVLSKALPIAAGLGGGSSDAGATLRLLRDILELQLGDQDLGLIAAELGADGPACFAARPVIGEGRGDRLSPAPGLPELHAVLVNPRVACPTGAVYRAYDEAGAPGRPDRPDLPDTFHSVEVLAAALTRCRNDLEAPAAAVAPEISTVLSMLRGEPETLLARLSGSGATAFALCAGALQAEALAGRLAGLRPAWWIRRCRLGGPWR